MRGFVSAIVWVAALSQFQESETGKVEPPVAELVEDAARVGHVHVEPSDIEVDVGSGRMHETGVEARVDEPDGHLLVHVFERVFRVHAFADESVSGMHVDGRAVERADWRIVIETDDPMEYQVVVGEWHLKALHVGDSGFDFQ